MTNNSKKMSPT